MNWAGGLSVRTDGVVDVVISVLCEETGDMSHEFGDWITQDELETLLLDPKASSYPVMSKHETTYIALVTGGLHRYDLEMLLPDPKASFYTIVFCT